jgi:asparagine synthase (glutamine-hydrolysing)
LDTLVTSKSAKDMTPYEGIFRLKPGHVLTCSGGSVGTEQYWQADPGKTMRFNQENEYVQYFREKLIRAVTMRCKGVRGLGTELSGGLDSSAVTGIAADFTASESSTVTAFSNIFPGTGVEFKDEREFIDDMITHNRSTGWCRPAESAC